MTLRVIAILRFILNPNQAVFFGPSKNRGGAESAPFGTWAYIYFLSFKSWMFGLKWELTSFLTIYAWFEWQKSNIKAQVLNGADSAPPRFLDWPKSTAWLGLRGSEGKYWSSKFEHLDFSTFLIQVLSCFLDIKNRRPTALQPLKIHKCIVHHLKILMAGCWYLTTKGVSLLLGFAMPS